MESFDRATPNVTKIKIDSSQVKETLAEEAAARYDVWIVNKTDWVIHELETASGQRVKYPSPIGKNCPGNDLSCEDCWTQGKADPIASSLCTEKPYNIILHVRKGDQQGVLKPILIQPRCDKAGDLICLE